MTHTYHQLYYHLAWSTKDRNALMVDIYQDRIYTYLGGAFRSLECTPIQIGGMPDHIHTLVVIPPKFSISDIVRKVKVSSNKWILENFSKFSSFSWQEGYGAFTVSASNKESVISYIQNQKQHHKQLSFKDEFLELLKKHEIDFHEKYLWK